MEDEGGGMMDANEKHADDIGAGGSAGRNASGGAWRGVAGSGGHTHTHLAVSAAESENRISAIHEILKAYEDGGFYDPGRAIDKIRDALGRRE